MLGSKMPVQHAEIIERTEHQRRLDDMFIEAMGGLANRYMCSSEEEYAGKLAALDDFVESDILGIYGAPTYLSRLSQLFRASDVTDELDENLGAKLSVFRTTLIHPAVVPHLNSSGMLLTMRLLADAQARMRYAPVEYVVLREVLSVMRLVWH